MCIWQAAHVRTAVFVAYQSPPDRGKYVKPDRLGSCILLLFFGDGGEEPMSPRERRVGSSASA